jgi:hypothetical protein
VKKHLIQEAIPVIVALLVTALGGFIAGFGASVFVSKIHLLLLLFAVTTVGFIGVHFSGLPLIEYILVLIVTAVIALVLIPLWKYIVIFPGIFMGYYWGAWMADTLDRQITE